MSEWDVVNLLRNARHDWLNKIQLIKGNLSLNHIERVNEIIDELIIEARHETKLSNMKFPKLAELLLTVNWEHHLFRLELEVIGDVKDLSVFEVPLYHFTSKFIHTINQLITEPNDHHLLISFHLYNDVPKVSFDFHGSIEDVNTIKEWLQTFELHKSISIIESYINNEEILITLQLDG